MDRIRTLERFALIAIGVCAFASVVPLEALDVTKLGWVMLGDGGQHVVGWEFFCHEDWRLPLGATHRFVAPAESSLLLTDAMPPVAALLRLVGACTLPEFQYLGPWLLVCFVLQPICAARLARAIGMERAGVFGVAIICAVAPILTVRAIHPTLCAHFLILLALELAVRASTLAQRSLVIRAFALNAVTSMLHPYLMAMVAPLSIIAASRAPRRASCIAAVLAANASGLFVTGAIGEHQDIVGFGTYQADVLGFIDSEGIGRLLPSTLNYRFEGYSYLGLGVLIAALLAIATRGRALEARFPREIWIFALAAWCFSLSTTVTLLGEPILRLDQVREWMGPIPSALRSSGRFAWPLWYVITFAAVAELGRHRRAGSITVVLVAAQLLDVGMIDPPVEAGPTIGPTLQDARWDRAQQGRSSIALVPPIILNSPLAVGGVWPNPAIWIPFARFAASRPPLTVNSGYLARPPVALLERSFRDLVSALEAGRPRADQLYVFSPLDPTPLSDAALCCTRMADATACVARGTPWPWTCETTTP